VKLNKQVYPWLILLAVVALLLPLMVSADTLVKPLLEQDDDDATPVAEPPPLETTEAPADDEPEPTEATPEPTPEVVEPAADETTSTSPDPVPVFVPQPVGPDLSGAVIYVDLTLLAMDTTAEGSALLGQAQTGSIGGVRVFEKPALAQLAPPRIHDTEGNAYDLVFTGAAEARTTVYMITFDPIPEPEATAEAPTIVEETPVVVPIEPEATAEAPVVEEPVATEDAPISIELPAETPEADSE
jgi:hypothetical protein